MSNNRHSLQAETSQQKTSQDHRENDATTLKQSGTKIQSIFVEAITHRKSSNESFKRLQDHKAMDWNPVIFYDETTVRLNCVKGLLWNLLGKKARANCQAHPIKVNVWGCFSSKGLGCMICFKQNLNVELMYDISKRGLLLTAPKQFDHDSMLWKPQEDNDSKHTWKLAVNWKRDNGVDEIHWPSMSPDLASIENIWQLLKMNLRKLPTFGFGDKVGMGVLNIGIKCKICP